MDEKSAKERRNIVDQRQNIVCVLFVEDGWKNYQRKMKDGGSKIKHCGCVLFVEDGWKSAKEKMKHHVLVLFVEDGWKTGNERWKIVCESLWKMDKKVPKKDETLWVKDESLCVSSLWKMDEKSAKERWNIVCVLL